MRKLKREQGYHLSFDIHKYMLANNLHWKRSLQTMTDFKHT